MEIIILSILSTQLRCEWRLQSYQVAVMSSVRKPTPARMLVKVGGRHLFSFWSQVVFLAFGIGNPVWGIFCDKYGRKIVSVTLFFLISSCVCECNCCLCVNQGLIISSCGMLYFGLLSTFAPMYSWFVFLRFLVGFGIAGGTQTYVPVSTDIFEWDLL